jgi:hypothetical protein
MLISPFHRRIAIIEPNRVRKRPAPILESIHGTCGRAALLSTILLSVKSKRQGEIYTMRFLFKISMPVEAGNAAARKDGLKAIQNILNEQKPEAAYFIAENGKRTAILVMNMDDASQLPAIAEPWFLAVNAGIEVTPAMIAADLQKAGPAIERAVKAHG